MTFIAWAVIYIGFAYVVGQSVISKPVRVFFRRRLGMVFLTDMLECPACLGFWTGLIVAGSAPSFAEAVLPAMPIGSLLCLQVMFALLTSGIGLMLGRLFGLMD